MEHRFGQDFGAVRAHSDGLAAESAQSIHASGFTAGSHVVFGAGRYAPNSPAEREAAVAARSGGPTFRSSADVTGHAPHVLAAAMPLSPGSSLAPAVRRSMEARFAHDFSRVRVHTDSAAADQANSRHASAYTVGRDVVFGSGRYAPDTEPGRTLLTHELTHVVQQSRSGVLAIQRDDAGTSQKTSPPDPEKVLGERLVKDFPSGVALAFYMAMPEAAEEARRAATAWAGRENAMALKGKKVTAGNIVFGQAMLQDDHPLVDTVKELGTLLPKAVAKAPPRPEGLLPPGMGPGTVRTLAVFAHGTSSWCGLGDVTSSNAASIIKSIAPALASNVNVILYSCNAGRSPDDSEDWVRGTMRSGGAKSLAAATRDALLAEGKSGSVWGHTTTGHVSENFALREFETTSGKGSEGVSFVMRNVFTGADKATTEQELMDGVIAQGFEMSLKWLAPTEAFVENEMYSCYAEANSKLTYAAGGKLAESAPTHPLDVGKQIKNYWTSTYWPARKAKAIDALAKDLKARGIAKKAKPITTP
jgi:hypothetical protein